MKAKVVAMAYTPKETGDLKLEVLSMEEIGDLLEEYTGQRYSFSGDPLSAVEDILEKMLIKSEIYGDYQAIEIER